MKQKNNNWSYVSLTISLVSLIFVLLSIYNNTILVDEFSYREVIYSPIKFLNDEAVLNVTAICENSTFKTKCVFDEIPFNYTDREYNDLRLIIPPVELYNSGEGLCRDISVFRMAVLYNLEVSASYIFQPGHMFVVTHENGNNFELNNEMMVEYEVYDYYLK